MLGRLTHDRDHFGLVIELRRYARADDRLQMRHHRRQHAEEDRRELRNIVAARALLDVVEIIEAEADDLAGPCDREAVFQSGARTAGGTGEIAVRAIDCLRNDIPRAAAVDVRTNTNYGRNCSIAGRPGQPGIALGLAT